MRKARTRGSVAGQRSPRRRDTNVYVTGITTDRRVTVAARRRRRALGAVSRVAPPRQPRTIYPDVGGRLTFSEHACAAINDHLRRVS